MRENATRRGIAIATAQTPNLAAWLRTALVIRSATPQYTATDAAVWPE